ncbi:xylan alpha-(1-_2)-glucuronosidase [Clostridia bacterium]|nr:xylan alpha-(1->2)-glucuronosidase [Clostridia bacterium]
MRSANHAWLPEKLDFSGITASIDAKLPPDSYRVEGNAVYGGDEAGLLYGKFAYLRGFQGTSAPAVRNRALNHWDNMTGDVERGYAGRSLFFKDGKIDYDPKRIEGYAALMASVGINQISLNNVNVTPLSARLITEDFLPQLSQLAAIFAKYYIRLLISVEFSAPQSIGGLNTCDPLDGNVAEWWEKQAALVYKHIPNLAGFLVKADSEFRTGPAALGRTQADGANVIARALEPHGGLLYWRCFVYNCQQDWRDTKTDRPKAAYDHFYPLDGKFDDNVILQIKNGPTDFQVREPNSPLLTALKHTREAIEFQVTQEYTGHQIDLYALAPQWEEVFATLGDTKFDAVCAVSNVGSDDSWTGHPLAQANFYAFGRLAWEPALTAKEIIGEWTRQTFDGAAVAPIEAMLLKSREVYEKYNAPLGIGWMVNIGHHYGPSVDGYEYMKWGTYHKANHTAIGIDRTKSGTGLTVQYPPEVAAVYENPETCPENLLLFFHRKPFTYRLKSGKTIIQHIYDTHFEGADEAAEFLKIWESLKGLVAEDIYKNALERFKLQAENAREWRDVVNTYFHRLTAIDDEKGRKIYE